MKTKVTLKDIYQVVNRLEDKVDKRLKALEKKVDILETFKDRALGLAVVLGLMAGVVVDWFKKKVLHFD